PRVRVQQAQDLHIESVEGWGSRHRIAARGCHMRNVRRSRGPLEHCFVLYQDFGHSYDFMSEQFIYVQIPAKLADGTVTPSGREGDGDFCEYPGEVEEDDRGFGAKANRDRRDPMDRPPVRGRARR